MHFDAFAETGELLTPSNKAAIPHSRGSDLHA